MPFGPYENFDACISDQIGKGKSQDSAKAICGKMQAEMGGSNFVEYSLDANGDLYLKYFFADTSTAKGTAVGDFNLGNEAITSADKEAAGLPFPILPSKDLSIKGDWHAWSPKEGATWEDHVEFARQYSPGHIVTITPNSNLVSAAMSDIKANNGRLAVVKIDNKEVRDAYVANPSLIPRQVSPGFMNLEAPNQTNIKKVRWAHLAAVPKGAFGDKATLYASCIGGNECVNHLVAASVKELDEKTRETYCPIGASEIISSLGDFTTNLQTSMSDNANTVATTTAVPAASSTASVVSTPAPQPKGAPISTPTKPIVRLKNQNTQANAVTSQSNAQEPTDDVATLKKEVEEMKALQQQQQRREEIKKLVPKELFIKKGKFDEKAFEAEVEKRLQSGATDEQLNEFYTLWSERDKLIQSGFTLQNTNPEAPQMPQAPMGGSAYQTHSEVPTGGSTTQDDYVSKSITELLGRAFIRRDA